MRTVILAISIALLGSRQLVGQGAPGTNLTVDLMVTSVVQSHDTVTIAFRLFNHPTSAERGLAVTLEAPSPPISIVTPTPASSWLVASLYGGRAVVSWGALSDTLFLPGSTSQVLTYRAVGLPGLTDGHIEGWALPIVEEDTFPSGDPLLFNAAQVKAVGVDPLPAGSTPATLTTRLDSLRGQTCTLSWITSSPLCTTLHGYLTAQPANLTQFNADLASGHTTGGPVTDNAYWLLKSNADYIISISPPPVNTALINLSYVCGNKFKVRNLNTVAVPLTWNVINGAETGAVTVPAKLPNGEPGSVFITTVEKRTLRLYYNGQLIATVANGNKPPC